MYDNKMFFEINGIKLLFIHIPKCAGTSIETKLNECSGHPIELENNVPNELSLWGQANGVQMQHFTFAEAKAHLENQKRKFDWAFSVVRDPMERFISELNWLSRTPYFSKDASVDFLLQKMSGTVKNKFPHFKHQHEFLNDLSNIDVFTIQELYKLEQRLTMLLGKTVVFDHLNVKKAGAGSNLEIKDRQEEIMAVLRPDYEFFQQNGI